MSSRSRQPTHARFDLLVIGGGIHGLFAALEAALRGWTVALVEREDFGSGLSFNHQRTVHGGLRALESGRVDKAMQQIAERRAWAVMAPHLLRPLPFLLPTRRDLKRSPTVIGTGLRIYDWIGRRRNAGLPAALHLPDSRIETAEAVAQIFPGVDRANLTGGARWYDYQVRHPDRLNWLVAAAAERAGAHLYNYTEATALIRDGRRVVGAHARDVLSNATFDVNAGVTLVCAGGAVPVVHAAFELPGAPLLLRACNLLVARPALDIALAAVGASGRTLTATPWSGRWLIGTFQSAEPATSSNARPAIAEVDAMIDDANRAFPTLQLRRQDVALMHSGLTPAVVKRGRLELMPEHVVLDHATHGHPGVFTLIGVKFTTARLAAVDALRKAGLAGRASRPASPVALPPQLRPHGGDAGALAAVEAESVECDVRIDDDIAAHLVDWYGTEASDVLRTSAGAGRLRRLAPDSPLLEGEIVHAIERARAQRLTDVVLRRTRLGAAGHPGRVALDAAAAVMAEHLDWSAERRAAEIARVEDRYRLG